MRKLGFDERWINRIMLCVSTITYQFRANGECIDNISPQRGLRQGDPFSSYLFLLCAEELLVLLNKAEEDGTLLGVCICHGTPRINHLLFADDLLVPMKATCESAISLQHMLQLYECCSGQTINYDKSAIMFSRNTKSWHKQGVLDELHISAEAWTQKYLDLPVYVGRSMADF
jgi:hypothetical protein